MSPIRVKETSAIRSEILDDLQRGYWTLRYDLLRTFDGSDDGIVVEVHRDALRDQQQCADQCSGQQDPEKGTRQINPEVASVSESCRARPRMKATPTANPAAPAKKFCAQSPTIWLK
jgi:hypothetical protein